VRVAARGQRPDDLDVSLAVTELVATLGDVAGAAVAYRATIGDVSTPACFLRALMDISKMLYVGPPGRGVAVSHVLLTLFRGGLRGELTGSR
jgi:hypothetical protein